MTADKQSSLVPKLRFPEFRHIGEWESRKLGEVVLRSKETFDPQKSRDTPHLIELENIESKTGRILGVAELKKHSGIKSKFYAGDVLFGKLRPYLQKFARPDFQGVCTSEVWVLRSREISSTFLFYLVQTERFIQLANISSGSRMPRAEWNFLSGADFEIPHPYEQQKIADCLDSLDDLIVAKGRKLEALRQHKQGLMQQLFPQPGEIVPRLRFPEFEDAGPWDQLTIDDVSDLKNGYAFRSDTYVESGDFKIVTIGNVQEGRLDLESTKSITNLPRDIQNHQILKPADILVSMTGNVGRVCLVPVDGLLLNQRVGKLIPHRIDHGFFYHTLNRNEFRSAMQLFAAGGAQGNLSAGGIKSFLFACPIYPKEQRGIANCLSTVDTQIAAQDRKLDALRQHRKGLIQQLFI